MKKCYQYPGKNRYSTQKDAETAILINSEPGQPELRYYYCDACDGWHLTSKTK